MDIPNTQNGKLPFECSLRSFAVTAQSRKQEEGAVEKSRGLIISLDHGSPFSYR